MREMEDKKRRLQDAVEEVARLVRDHALRGVHAPLPARSIPVPELGQTLANVPMSWANSFRRFSAKGRQDDWHSLTEEIRGKLDFHFIRMFGKDFTEVMLYLQDSLSELSLEQLDAKWPRHLSDDVYMCLEIIVKARFLGQDISGFAELLRRSYQAGGAPCGWLGKFAEGRMIVFWPYEQEPEFEKD